LCGICGAYDPSGKPPLPGGQLERMVDAINHRGPDGRGVYLEGGVALGHSRLAIIDLSTGDQPMFSPDGNLVVVFNGEIYNYRELKKKLIGRGMEFNSNSDTEVILQLYAHGGLDALPELNGIFAFALWDQREERLVLARDRMGIKPLYYSVLPSGKVIFGSEVKSLLASGEISAEVDHLALWDLFSFQNVFGKRTLYKGVELLEPGRALVIDRRCLASHVFHRLKFEEGVDHGSEYYREALTETFRQAVVRQLVSDVPVGGYLSGGMDSGSICAVAARELRPFHTFTCGFDTSEVSEFEAAFDERVAAEELARLLGTQHHECHLYPDAMSKIMPTLVWHLEEPRVGISYQVYYTAAMIKKFVTVVLAGVGGDELFAGYPWRYEPASRLDDPAEFADHYYRTWVRFLDEEGKKRFFSPEVVARVSGYSSRDSFDAVMDDCPAELPLNKALYFDLKTFLAGLLSVEDKLSMAHAVESRVPFLDNELVDLALKIPPHHKLRDGKAKLILKEAMGSLMPSSVLKRAKQGFTPPDMSWYRGDSLGYIRQSLLSAETQTREFFAPGAVEEIIDQHLTGKFNHRFLIWTLLYFEWWHRIFIGGENPGLLSG